MRIFTEREKNENSCYPRAHVTSISSMAGKVGLGDEIGISRVRAPTFRNARRVIYLHFCASTRKIKCP